MRDSSRDSQGVAVGAGVGEVVVGRASGGPGADRAPDEKRIGSAPTRVGGEVVVQDRMCG